MNMKKTVAGVMAGAMAVSAMATTASALDQNVSERALTDGQFVLNYDLNTYVLNFTDTTVILKTNYRESEYGIQRVNDYVLCSSTDKGAKAYSYSDAHNLWKKGTSFFYSKYDESTGACVLDANVIAEKPAVGTAYYRPVRVELGAQLKGTSANYDLQSLQLEATSVAQDANSTKTKVNELYFSKVILGKDITDLSNESYAIEDSAGLDFITDSNGNYTGVKVAFNTKDQALRGSFVVDKFLDSDSVKNTYIKTFATAAEAENFAKTLSKAYMVKVDDSKATVKYFDTAKEAAEAADKLSKAYTVKSTADEVQTRYFKTKEEAEKFIQTLVNPKSYHVVTDTAAVPAKEAETTTKLTYEGKETGKMYKVEALDKLADGSYRKQLGFVVTEAADPTADDVIYPESLVKTRADGTKYVDGIMKTFTNDDLDWYCTSLGQYVITLKGSGMYFITDIKNDTNALTNDVDKVKPAGEYGTKGEAIAAINAFKGQGTAWVADDLDAAFDVTYGDAVSENFIFGASQDGKIKVYFTTTGYDAAIAAAKAKVDEENEAAKEKAQEDYDAAMAKINPKKNGWYEVEELVPTHDDTTPTDYDKLVQKGGFATTSAAVGADGTALTADDFVDPDDAPDTLTRATDAQNATNANANTVMICLVPTDDTVLTTQHEQGAPADDEGTDETYYVLNYLPFTPEAGRVVSAANVAKYYIKDVDGAYIPVSGYYFAAGDEGSTYTTTGTEQWFYLDEEKPITKVTFDDPVNPDEKKVDEEAAVAEYIQKSIEAARAAVEAEHKKAKDGKKVTVDEVIAELAKTTNGDWTTNPAGDEDQAKAKDFLGYRRPAVILDTVPFENIWVYKNADPQSIKLQFPTEVDVKPYYEGITVHENKTTTPAVPAVEGKYHVEDDLGNVCKYTVPSETAKFYLEDANGNRYMGGAGDDKPFYLEDANGNRYMEKSEFVGYSFETFTVTATYKVHITNWDSLGNYTGDVNKYSIIANGINVATAGNTIVNATIGSSFYDAYPMKTSLSNTAKNPKTGIKDGDVLASISSNKEWDKKYTSPTAVLNDVIANNEDVVFSFNSSKKYVDTNEYINVVFSRNNGNGTYDMTYYNSNGDLKIIKGVASGDCLFGSNGLPTKFKNPRRYLGYASKPDGKIVPDDANRWYNEIFDQHLYQKGSFTYDNTYYHADGVNGITLSGELEGDGSAVNSEGNPYSVYGSTAYTTWNTNLFTGGLVINSNWTMQLSDTTAFTWGKNNLAFHWFDVVKNQRTGERTVTNYNQFLISMIMYTPVDWYWDSLDVIVGNSASVDVTTGAGAVDDGEVIDDTTVSEEAVEEVVEDDLFEEEEEEYVEEPVEEEEDFGEEEYTDEEED